MRRMNRLLTDKELNELVKLSFEEIEEKFGITKILVYTPKDSYYRIQTKAEAERKRIIVDKFLSKY